MSRTRTPLPDPAVRPDGMCAQCGKPRHPEWSLKYGGPAAGLDAFCSATCCREYHGTQLDCSACNGPTDQQTDGCMTCATRAGKQRKAAAA
jgi:hypothetical protein